MQTQSQKLLNSVNTSTERWRRQGFQRRFSVTDLHGVEYQSTMATGVPAQFYTSVSYDFDRFIHWWCKIIIRPYGVKTPITQGSNSGNTDSLFEGDGDYTGGDITYGGNTLSKDTVKAIMALSKEYSLLPSGIISQMYLESNWGNSPVGKADNNWSGIKYTSPTRPSGVTVSQGTPSPEGDSYARYANVSDYLKDHFYLLADQTAGNNAKMYNVKGKTTFNDYIKGLFVEGGALYNYATAGYPSYLQLSTGVRSGINTANDNILDKLDEQILKPKENTTSTIPSGSTYQPVAPVTRNGRKFSGLITDVDTNLFNGDNSRRTIDRIVIHHNAGTSDESARRTWYVSTGRGTSAHYQVTPDKLWGCVSETDTAYHAGNYTMNQRSIGIEHLNNAGAPNWTIAEETYVRSARLIADICNRYNIPCDRNHIIGHKEVPSSTLCPAGINVDRLVSMAKAILKGGTANDAQPTQPKVEKADKVLKALADLAAKKGVTLGNGECYGLAAYYSKLLGGVGLGGGVTGLSHVIGDTLSAKNIGTGYNWAEVGWAVATPKSVDDIKAGSMITFHGTASNPYGHVAVVKSVSKGKITVLEQNFDFKRYVVENTYDASTYFPTINQVIYPPELVQGKSTSQAQNIDSSYIPYTEPFADDIKVSIDGIDLTPMFKEQFDGKWINDYAVFPNDKPNEGYDIMWSARGLSQEECDKLFRAGEHLVEISGSMKADVILRMYLKYNHLN